MSIHHIHENTHDISRRGRRDRNNNKRGHAIRKSSESSTIQQNEYTQVCIYVFIHSSSVDEIAIPIMGSKNG